ncbi:MULTISPECIES: peptidoglycan-binding protein [unclassified Streptomyces]|uniref:peptidoglycan-binding protein n=1 Tax=unclassified Streptomyces TaxID=2593676 RepID=UPI001F5B7292|nr:MULTISPECIES: peptidoglycan-binding protein [unclassified Streptomyces]
MTMHERGGQDRQQSAGIRLAQLLRRWWEEAGGSSGGARPTQQALASRLGVDQTTLSRYLNPRHTSTASLRVVDNLHAQLRAPAAELEQARALCRAAWRENSRQREAEGGGDAPATPTDGTERSAGTTGTTSGRPDDAGTSATGAGARGVGGEAAGVKAVAGARPGAAAAEHVSSHTPARLRPRWLLPALFVSAVALAFAAGAMVHDRLSSEDPATTAAGAPGAVSASEAPYKWPLLRMGVEDQFTRARALQYLLNARGYDLRADGFFRQDTWDAVVDFQKRNDLQADGKVGEKTWPELVVDVEQGSGELEVRAVQELLNNVGLGARRSRAGSPR